MREQAKLSQKSDFAGASPGGVVVSMWLRGELRAFWREESNTMAMILHNGHGYVIHSWLLLAYILTFHVIGMTACRNSSNPKHGLCSKLSVAQVSLSCILILEFLEAFCPWKLCYFITDQISVVVKSWLYEKDRAENSHSKYSQSYWLEYVTETVAIINQSCPQQDPRCTELHSLFCCLGMSCLCLLSSHW